MAARDGGGDVEHRLTALEAELAGIRFDLELQRKAWRERSREFRQLELAVNTMTANQQTAREAEAAQYRRLELRIQVLTLVIGAAAVVSPLITVVVVHG